MDMNLPYHDHEEAKELVGKILGFLQYQIENNNMIPGTSHESLAVASECIEQSFGLEKKAASSELLDIYKKSKSQSQPSGPNVPQSDPMTMFRTMASAFLNPATEQSPPVSTNSAPTADSTSSANNFNIPPPKKDRKQVSEAEKISAESFKNQGNDYMRIAEYQLAAENYTKAIEIDPNNAIYYCNRAASATKLCDYQSALKDCREAISIDPTYGKAYSRMGLAYASMNEHTNARDAYKKAVELDPTNQANRDNLKIEEERCGPASSGSPTGENIISSLMSMMNNPDMVQMAMRTIQDPRLHGLISQVRSTIHTQQPPQPPPE